MTDIREMTRKYHNWYNMNVHLSFCRRKNIATLNTQIHSSTFWELNQVKLFKLSKIGNSKFTSSLPKCSF